MVPKGSIVDDLEPLNLPTKGKFMLAMFSLKTVLTSVGAET